jgi:hypothetical protein
MVNSHARGAGSSLRGWLSEVFLPALVSANVDQLSQRLGDRATVDDPMFGRFTGMPELARRLEIMASWLASRGAVFEKSAFTMGSDRDVTEGTLALAAELPMRRPVALVAERRPGREVELRVYYRARDFGAPDAREHTNLSDEAIVPPPVASHLDALARGDVNAAVASFEEEGTLCDAAGVLHTKIDGGGSLRTHYESLGSVKLLKNARADDGRTCAIECTMIRMRGERLAPRRGLAVYERGESGLLKRVRLYDDIEA